MPEVQKTWVRFKHFFQTSQRELRETSNLTTEDAEIHHANMGATLSLTTRSYLDGDTGRRAGACGSCGQRDVKHQETVGHTSAENSVDDADHADAL